ncbi:MAG: PTS sugar transporter subunit IIC [Candidatus Eremiobacteraeota bacterium]|nr:PTS sugar transporter subunit IIC [Candidatus Eremiobacteraeota bacterium]MBV8366395.1 PTS sugar transporter subunit IIC [Candidatus Eremiobacteraeota bacterium]
MKLSAARGLDAAVGALEMRLLPRLQRAADEPHFAAVRASIQPAFWVMAATTVLVYFWIPPRPIAWHLSALFARFLDAYHIGFGAMGVALMLLLANNLALRLHYNRIAAIILTSIAFALSLPRPVPLSPLVLLGTLSASSLFLAIIVASISGEMMRWIRRFISNLPLALAVSALAVIVVFAGIAALLAPSHQSVADVLLATVKPLIGVGDTLPALLLVVFLQVLLWTAGVHGPGFLAALTTPIFLGAIDANGQALLHHEAPPHIVTITLFLFFFPGGSGATLPLNLLMLFSKIPRIRRLGYASLLPSIINVNEPLIFGLPLVMNPTLTIPFICVPLILATTTYVAMYFGLVDKTVVFLPSAIPAPIAAWLTTNGDWRAVVLVLGNIVLAFVLYAPFYRSFEEALRAKPEQEAALVKTAEAIREHELALERHPETAEGDEEPSA